MTRLEALRKRLRQAKFETKTLQLRLTVTRRAIPRLEASQQIEIARLEARKLQTALTVARKLVVYLEQVIKEELG